MKITFSKHWGWSSLSEWGGGDRLPNAVGLPDDKIVDLSWDRYNATSYEYFTLRHPRSRAKFTPMNADSTVRLIRRTGGSDPHHRSGQRWSRMIAIVPKGSAFLYGGRCESCGDGIEYSDDTESIPLCTECKTDLAETQRLQEEERAADEEYHCWLEAEGYIR